MFMWSNVFVKIKTINVSCYSSRVCAKMPIVPIRVAYNTGSRITYALLDTGSEETLVSCKLYDDLKLNGAPCKCVLFTGNNE